MEGRQERVHERARHLWESRGRPEGQDLEFWLEAERQVGGSTATIGALPGRNVVLNGNFAINQRAYASGGTLAGGAYAHDRWKAGAAGCTYTFARSVPDTVLTITAGSLVQAVDAPQVHASSWWLTWTGTAQARVWQGTAAGDFSAGVERRVGGVSVSALHVPDIAIGEVTMIEFEAGTLGLVQFEAAPAEAGPTPFERRLGELALCQQYYQTSYDDEAPGSASGSLGVTQLYCGQTCGYAPLLLGLWPVTMRVVPTVTIYNNLTGEVGMFNNNGEPCAGYAPYVTRKAFSFNSSGTAVTQQTSVSFQYTADAEL